MWLRFRFQSHPVPSHSIRLDDVIEMLYRDYIPCPDLRQLYLSGFMYCVRRGMDSFIKKSHVFFLLWITALATKCVGFVHSFWFLIQFISMFSFAANKVNYMHCVMINGHWEGCVAMIFSIWILHCRFSYKTLSNCYWTGQYSGNC